jgi:chromosome segregation ATPase
MEPTSQKGDKPKLKDAVEICQGFLNILRDSLVFLIFLLLFLNPVILNKILAKAGFVKAEIAGFQWEKQLEETDSELIEATNQIDVLKKRLEESNNIISKLNEDIKIKDQKVEGQITKNQEAVQEATSINSGIQTTLKANTPLLNPRVNAELNSLLDIINGYKIQIFYNESKPNQRNVASEIKGALEKAGVKSTIQILPQLDKASSDQIRYFAENEREVAYALQNVLEEAYPKYSFKLQTVYTPSPGSISVFLKS